MNASTHTDTGQDDQLLEMMEELENRLLVLVCDELGDPDFRRLARGVTALARMQGMLQAREAAAERKAAKRKAEMDAPTGLAGLRLSDEERRKMDADAARLARRERGAHDTKSQIDHENNKGGREAPHRPLPAAKPTSPANGEKVCLKATYPA